MKLTTVFSFPLHSQLLPSQPGFLLRLKDTYVRVVRGGPDPAASAAFFGEGRRAQNPRILFTQRCEPRHSQGWAEWGWI